jgi:glycosyltransferase involved in cell wall biosynthesis
MTKIIIGIPCHNEEKTIAKVVSDFKKELPEAAIWVVDNNSSDQTAAEALRAGALVFSEKKKGKGFAVQRLFEEFEGDILVLVDGDDTYPVEAVSRIITPILEEEAEMVVGNRIHRDNSQNFSGSHWLGNQFLTQSLNLLFGSHLKDMESGLRALSKKFVDSSALLAGGFGIEPEISIQALEKGMRIKEVPILVEKRKAGSVSKLNTFRDGTIVLYTVLSLFRDYKPLQFFSWLAGMLFLSGIGLGYYSTREYFSTGIVEHIPALVVAGFFLLASFVSFIAGLILSSIKRRHDELVVLLNRHKKH